jgi:hypothetical protein
MPAFSVQHTLHPTQYSERLRFACTRDSAVPHGNVIIVECLVQKVLCCRQDRRGHHLVLSIGAHHLVRPFGPASKTRRHHFYCFPSCIDDLGQDIGERAQK